MQEIGSDGCPNEMLESSKLVKTFKWKDKIGVGEVNADVNGTTGLISILKNRDSNKEALGLSSIL